MVSRYFGKERVDIHNGERVKMEKAMVLMYNRTDWSNTTIIDGMMHIEGCLMHIEEYKEEKLVYTTVMSNERLGELTIRDDAVKILGY